MNFENIISNSDVPLPIRERLEKLTDKNEKVQLVVTGDYLLDAKYGMSALCVTNSRLICVQDSNPDSNFFISFDKIESMQIKRMYGNALLIVNGSRVLRFSFSVVAFVEAAVEYIRSINNGTDMDEALQTARTVVEKKKHFCPKCGHSLLRPGAPCINCASKGKLAKRLWKYISSQKSKLIFSILLSAVTTAITLVPPYITKMLVDDVIPDKNTNLLLQLVIALLTVYLLQAVLGTVRARLLRLAGDRIVTDLRKDVFAKTEHLKVDYFDKTGTGSIHSRITNDTARINAFLLRISQEAVVQFFLMIGIMVIMIAFNWKLAILSLLPVPIVVGASKIFRAKMKPYYHKIGFKWLSICDMISDSLPGIRVTKAFTGEERTIEKFAAVNEEWFEMNKKSSVATSLFPQAVTFFITCGSLVIWGIGGNWAISGTGGMTAGLLVSFISYASMFYNPVNFFANLSDSYTDALTSAERILDILDSDSEADDGKDNKIAGMKGKIEFRNVSFSFDNTAKVLDNINLTVEPGDIIGIVGTTGAGKTTLINLLMRYYDKYEGEILIDGEDIRKISLEDYRTAIGFVQQEPLMFKDTIFNNIALSDPKISVEKVIEAAEVANAHDFIRRLPDAYDTVLGERGIGVSGGEKQRLSIARAVIKNPSVLIFDEATASVDSKTEHLIQEAIERLISGRTTIMIAHRLSTLRRANKIAVIDNGQVAEYGSHEELMALKGKYYNLVEIQNLSEEIRKRAQKERLEEAALNG